MLRPMRVVIGLVVVLHLLGAAAIIGPWLAAPRSGRIRMAMVWGARAQVATGNGEQARVQLPVGREPSPRAVAAERRRHRRDDPEFAGTVDHVRRAFDCISVVVTGCVMTYGNDIRL